MFVQFWDETWISIMSQLLETFFYNLAFQIRCLAEIPLLAKKYGFDLIHSHMSHMPDVLAELLNLVRVPTVVTVHSTIRMQTESISLDNYDVGELEWSEKNALLLSPIIHFLQRNYVKHISKFIAVSKTTRDLMQEQLNVKPEKITVVHNGVDTRLFSPPQTPMMRRKNTQNTM